MQNILLRIDIGELWENYLLPERVKYQQYIGMIVNNYFWRTYYQQKIYRDEERRGNLFDYEIKWNNIKIKLPGSMSDAYTYLNIL